MISQFVSSFIDFTLKKKSIWLFISPRPIYLKPLKISNQSFKKYINNTTYYLLFLYKSLTVKNADNLLCQECVGEVWADLITVNKQILIAPWN